MFYAIVNANFMVKIATQINSGIEICVDRGVKAQQNILYMKFLCLES